MKCTVEVTKPSRYYPQPTLIIITSMPKQCNRQKRDYMSDLLILPLNWLLLYAASLLLSKSFPDGKASVLPSLSLLFLSSLIILSNGTDPAGSRFRAICLLIHRLEGIVSQKFHCTRRTVVCSVPALVSRLGRVNVPFCPHRWHNRRTCLYRCHKVGSLFSAATCPLWLGYSVYYPFWRKKGNASTWLGRYWFWWSMLLFHVYSGVGRTDGRTDGLKYSVGPSLKVDGRCLHLVCIPIKLSYILSL